MRQTSDVRYRPAARTPPAHAGEWREMAELGIRPLFTDYPGVPHRHRYYRSYTAIAGGDSCDIAVGLATGTRCLDNPNRSEEPLEESEERSERLAPLVGGAWVGSEPLSSGWHLRSGSCHETPKPLQQPGTDRNQAGFFASGPHRFDLRNEFEESEERSEESHSRRYRHRLQRWRKSPQPVCIHP